MIGHRSNGGKLSMVDMGQLGDFQELWDQWRFLPWNDGTASGLYRRVSFIKAGIMGEVGRYYADDYIVWRYEESDVERLFRAVEPQHEVMLQRFLFVQHQGETTSKRRMMRMGFSGFVEVYRYTPGASDEKAIKDLSYLVDQAWCRQQTL